MLAFTLIHQWQFWTSARLDSDVLALLPQDERRPAVNAASRGLADAAAREVVVLVGASSWGAAQTAADAVSASLTQAPLERRATDAAGLETLLEFYRPWRAGLLTPNQREQLTRAGSEALGEQALLNLYQSVGPKLSTWRDDPLGLWPSWWSERAGETRARLRDGRLWLSAEGRDWIVLSYESRTTGFTADDSAPITSALALARAAAGQAVPGAEMLAAGVPLYSEAAAAQASRETSLIGTGSMIAVLLLTWLCFRSLSPILLVALSLVVGCAVALSVTALAFERIHLLTLVFGASLVGVAEDYGIHYFAARQGRPASERFAVLRSILPGLLMALSTSVLAYLALGLAPFPGLQQMALFSAVGLIAAFLTVLCWYPWLDRRPLPPTRLANWLAQHLPRWPRWRNTRLTWAVAIAGLFFTIAGLLQLDSRDELRQLQSAPPALIADQTRITKLLGLTSPAQFFLVEGADAQEVLAREEALKPRLDSLRASAQLHGYRAVSDWVPSRAQQAADAQRVADAEARAITAVARTTGAVPETATRVFVPLELESWLAGPAAATVRAQWLPALHEGAASVITLSGVERAHLPALAAAATGLPGVSFIDRSAEMAELMARYRNLMGLLLLAGFAAVWGALALRYGRKSWRAVAPTALGALLTLAIFGWVGQPFSLFTVLALALLLGMGVDYGIFLLEHPNDGKAWLAVALAGVSTLLAFGLLGLSETPALHAFGLTMAVGEVLIWLLTPALRPDQPH